MATINYFIRTKQKKNPVNIRCRLRSGKDVDLYANTHIRVLPENWISRTESIKEVVGFETREKFVKLKGRLNDIILSQTNETFLNGSSVNSLNWLEYQIEKFHDPKKFDGVKSFFEFIEEFIEKAPARLQKNGKPVCYKMQREYSRTFHYLKEFAKHQGKEPDFIDIDLDFYNEFIDFLTHREKVIKLKNGKEKKVFGLSTNTVGKKIQTLKIFLNAATDKGLNQNLKFKTKFYAISEDSETIYLTTDDLNKLWEFDLSNNDKLERVRDLFLVGCWTGCRFGDYKQINPYNIRDGFIHIEQEKTGNRVIIPVHPVVNAIIEKYNGNLPKVISNQKFNEYLKVVAQKAGLNESIEKSITRGGLRVKKRYPKYDLVSSHTARRSFATNLYKQGFPSQSIMKITGHKTEQAFLRYIRVTPQEHADMLMNFWRDNGEHLKIAR